MTKAYQLLAKLRCLTLAGKNSDGELEWIGTSQQWDEVGREEESILRDHEIRNIFILHQ